MKICVKEKLEEITPHAFEKKVLEREMAKGGAEGRYVLSEKSDPVGGS